MPSETFNLPQTSIDVLEKVIIGYANAGNDVGRDDVAGIIGLHANRVSESNGFLVETGLVNQGNKKTATDLAKRLGRALEFNNEEDIKNSYKQVVESTDFLAKLVTYVRLSKNINQDKLAERALYLSGQSSENKNAKTGSKAVSEILLRSGLVIDRDGVLEVATPLADGQEPPQSDSIKSADQTSEEPQRASFTSPASVAHSDSASRTPNPSVNINIELTLPATENAEIYENLFKAMRENLFPSDE